MSVLPPSVEWADGVIRIIDQRLLPAELRVRELTTVDDVIDAISTLAVRGANVIGTTGALGLALGIRSGLDPALTAQRLIAARPTAVNLTVAVDIVLAAHSAGDDALDAALTLLREDAESCRRIGEFGRIELSGTDRVLTHCNTGRLATTGWGTALGVIYAKHEAGEPIAVIATETRPLRQGARLTAWELAASGIDVELIADSAAAAALASGRVGAVIVGADRIAANGDTVNKIGTRALAVAAHYEGVPFYVAATLNAVDVDTATGDDITIELRDGAELAIGDEVLDSSIAVWNPAFDSTPAELITGIITEVGVLRPPFDESLRKAVGR